MNDLGRLSCALFYEDLAIGTRWKTAGRTIVEPDLTAYIGLTWFHEDRSEEHTSELQSLISIA